MAKKSEYVVMWAGIDDEDGEVEVRIRKDGERLAYCSIAALIDGKQIRFSPKWIEDITGLQSSEAKYILTHTLPDVTTSPEAEFVAATTAMKYLALILTKNADKAFFGFQAAHIPSKMLLL